LESVCTDFGGNLCRELNMIKCVKLSVLHVQLLQKYILFKSLVFGKVSGFYVFE